MVTVKALLQIMLWSRGPQLPILLLLLYDQSRSDVQTWQNHFFGNIRFEDLRHFLSHYFSAANFANN